MKMLLINGYTAIGTDITEGVDFLTEPTPAVASWIITNPPFSLAEDFIRRAHASGRPFALLLKSQFWHAAGRLPLFQSCPPDIIAPLTWRPDFNFKSGKRGSPLMDVMWCVWLPCIHKTGTSRYIPLEKPREQKGAFYAKQLYCLGFTYNEALIGPETNFSTYPTKMLNLMGYHKLFVREVEDEYTGQLRHSFGFQTNRITRPVILSELIRILRDHTALLNDETTILEMLTFVRNDKLRPEAEPGAHDDLVMALAIAYYIRPQQSMMVQVEEIRKKNKWTADMWQDYENADASMRALMLKEWGDPD